MIELFTKPNFTGGTLIQVRFTGHVDTASIRAALTTVHLGDSVIQEFGDSREYIVRTGEGASGASELATRVEVALRSHPSLGAFEIRRVEFVGPQVGRDLQLQAIYAVIAAVAGILIYLTTCSCAWERCRSPSVSSLSRSSRLSSRSWGTL